MIYNPRYHLVTVSMGQTGEFHTLKQNFLVQANLSLKVAQLTKTLELQSCYKNQQECLSVEGPPPAYR